VKSALIFLTSVPGAVAVALSPTITVLISWVILD
jgi:hypothetical protein